MVVVVALTGFGGASGTAAAAQAPSYQPDSPAGTEYAIPLDEARKTGSTSDGTTAHRDASGGRSSGSSSGADSTSALFGEGISPKKAAAGTSRKPPKTTTKPTRAASASPPASVRIRPASSGISGTAVAVGTGGLVLALGAALTGAAVLSRRMPRSR
jgi:hypothetical protein